MARKLTKKDVVIIGLGWTGSIIANELTDEGLDVIAIERGPWRDAPTEYPPNYVQDELRYRIRHELFLRPEQTTFTFRNKMDQTALPIRSWGAFMPPNGVGGGGVHWNAETWRFLPSDFVVKTHLTQRYGAGFLPEGMTIQDWGVTYDELEPHTTRSNISAARRGRPATCAARFRRAATRSRDRARGPIPIPRRRNRSATPCSRRRRVNSATSRFRSRRETCRRPTPIRSAFAWGRAPIAASASGSDAATIPRPVRRRRSSRS